MNKEILIKGLSELNAEISDDQIEKFARYSSLLKEWNEKMNLTAVTDDDGISVKHFLDSILPLYCVDFDNVGCLIDVGCGAGFPSIPMKIMRPDIKMTLLDSLNKRVNFLKTVSDEICLENVSCIHGRAEELAKDKAYREKFDTAVSRAVANMTVLSEYCLPYVRVGGMFVALKAENVESEVFDAEKVIEQLGGEVEDIIKIPLPQSDMLREIVVVRKVRNTPDKFPRRADKIKKSAKSK